MMTDRENKTMTEYKKMYRETLIKLMDQLIISGRISIDKSYYMTK